MSKPRILFVLAALWLPAIAVFGEEPAPPDAEPPRVEIETTMGGIVIELFRDEAPLSVKNFLDYVSQGFYDGTIFHRVIPDFMVQGGGFDSDLQLRPPAGMLTNEADNGLSNLRGTVAMARRAEAHTATSQFFINHADNPELDHRGKENGAAWGYAVFGRVAEGMVVVDAIAGVPTGSGPRGMRDVPLEPVVIESAVWVNAPASEEATVTLD